MIEGTKVVLRDKWIDRLEATLRKQNAPNPSCDHLYGMVWIIKNVGTPRKGRQNYRLVPADGDTTRVGAWYPKSAIKIAK